MKRNICVSIAIFVLSVVVFTVCFSFLIAFFMGEPMFSPEEQTKPSQGVTVDLGPGRIDIQAPGFSGKCERCPEDCR